MLYSMIVSLPLQISFPMNLLLPPTIQWIHRRVVCVDRVVWMEDVEATTQRFVSPEVSKSAKRLQIMHAHVVRRFVCQYGASVFDLIRRVLSHLTERPAAFNSRRVSRVQQHAAIHRGQRVAHPRPRVRECAQALSNR